MIVGDDLANAGLKSAEVIATITRADGTVEHLGVIDSYHAPEAQEPARENPLRRLLTRRRKG